MKKEFLKYLENILPFGCNIITAILVVMSMALAINFACGISKIQIHKVIHMMACLWALTFC